MPLRDHFRPPKTSRQPWEGVHAMWPAMIVRALFDILPKGYVAEPGVHIGRAFKIDVSAFQENEATVAGKTAMSGNGGVAVAAPPEPIAHF